MHTVEGVGEGSTSRQATKWPVEVLQTLHGAASDTPWVATWCNGLYQTRPAFLFFVPYIYIYI